MSTKEQAAIQRILQEQGVKEWEPEAIKLLVTYLERQQQHSKPK